MRSNGVDSPLSVRAVVGLQEEMAVCAVRVSIHQQRFLPVREKYYNGK